MSKLLKFGLAGIIIALGATGSSAQAQNAMYQRCEPSTDCIIGEFIFDDDGHTPITTDNYCQITITNPADSVIVNGANMSDKNDGWHYYTANIASPNGLYRASMCCDTGAARQCIDKTFVLGTSLDTVADKTDIAGIAAGVWSYGTRALNSFDTLVNGIWAATTRRLTDKTLAGGDNLATESYLGTDKTELLAAINSNAALISTRSSQNSVDVISASRQKEWTVYMSDASDISKGETYRAKLFALNYESTPADLFTTPTATIYDPLRNTVVENVAMTKLSTGIYEYTYTVASSAVQGMWETEVSASVDSGKIVKTNDYWNVAGSPAQVIINSISDNTIPSVSANITITNEGSAGYEYRYEWCVVDSQDNACGGSDDVFYSSAAKYIQPGQDWVTDLSATVPSAGNYYFKIMVYFGTDRSGASQSFAAVAGSSGGSAGGGGGSNFSGQTVLNGLTAIGQAICNQNTFPCNIIIKILARLDKSEKNTASLQASVASLNASVNKLLNAAPRQVIVKSPPAVKYVAPKTQTPAPSAPKRKANIKLEI